MPTAEMVDAEAMWRQIVTLAQLKQEGRLGEVGEVELRGLTKVYPVLAFK